jgi:hypothetical protein
VLFVSSAYASKLWTKRELASAQARALREHSEYVLPARLDDTDIPGLTPTIAYIDLRQKSPNELADLIVSKVAGRLLADQGRPDRASLRDPYNRVARVGHHIMARRVILSLVTLVIVLGLLIHVVLNERITQNDTRAIHEQPARVISDVALADPGGTLIQVRNAPLVAIPAGKAGRVTMRFGPDWKGVVVIYRESGEIVHSFKTSGHGFWEPQVTLLTAGKYFVMSWHQYQQDRQMARTEQDIDQSEDEITIYANSRDNLDMWVNTAIRIIDVS